MLQNQRQAAEALDADDQFAAAAAAALATTLQPWFSGERELNYGFVGMLEWASGGFSKNLSPGGN